jgi:hypothetical protein
MKRNPIEVLAVIEEFGKAHPNAAEVDGSIQ